MLRLLNVVVLFCMVATAVVVYEVKYQSTYEAQKAARLEGEIRVERERIATLKGEWAELSAPARIQGLAVRYLGLKRPPVTHIDDFSQLPEMIKVTGDPIGDIIDALPGHAGGKRDPIGNIIETFDAKQSAETTGSVDTNDRDGERGE